MTNLSPKTLVCTIDYVDNLGQGVDKKLDKITLIPKTLPGEEVEVVETFTQSKVRFTQLSKVLRASAQRQNPSCIHFEQCPGCHYLHTDYETEKKLKVEHAQHLFKKFSEPTTIEFIPAPERLRYRNRIQLHYSKSEGKLGFIDGAKTIFPVEECQIVHPKLKEKVRALYLNDAWKKLVQTEKEQGHLELYLKEDRVELNLNKPYAEGGFSQVNQAMNDLLVEKITQLYRQYGSHGPILDLFGGNGNLTQKITTPATIWCVDNYQKPPVAVGPQRFFALDLYQKHALSKFQKQHPEVFPTLIVDPPRSGFKDLKEWSDALKVQTIIYVSCHPQTQVRDLEKMLGPYRVEKVFIFDLFPSTFHFESVVVLSKTFAQDTKVL